MAFNAQNGVFILLIGFEESRNNKSLYNLHVFCLEVFVNLKVLFTLVDKSI